MTEEVKGRSYDNSGRAAQAKATRQKILESARNALVGNGYAATTMPLIAQQAGVSVETVYKHFRTKAALTRAVRDVTIAGDDEPIPMAERPEAHAIASAPNAREMVRRYAHYVRGIHERMGQLPAVLLTGARAGEADLQEIGAEADEQRLTGANLFARLLLSTGETRVDLGPEEARDIIWTLNSPDIHRMFTVERQRSGDEYEVLLARTLVGALLSAGQADEGRRHPAAPADG